MSGDETSEGLWRIFCAVELPEEVRARAAEYAAALREGAGAVRASWDRAEKMHVTLKFIGEVDAARAARVQEAAGRAAASASRFPLAVEGTGAFHTRGRPHVLWLGVRDDAGGLSELNRLLEDECAREGFARESRRFHPHLTLARLRSPEGARELAERHRASAFQTEPFDVRELLVVRSELAPEGSRYTTISRHALKE